MKSSRKIIVGAYQVQAVHYGIESRICDIDETHDVAAVRDVGSELLQEIKPMVVSRLIDNHRRRMQHQRDVVDRIQAVYGKTWYQGPRPDLVSKQPWHDTRFGDWIMVPHGVAARLVRGSEGTDT